MSVDVCASLKLEMAPTGLKTLGTYHMKEKSMTLSSETRDVEGSRVLAK